MKIFVVYLILGIARVMIEKISQRTKSHSQENKFGKRQKKNSTLSKQPMYGSSVTGLLTRRMTMIQVTRKTKMMITTMRKMRMMNKTRQLTLLPKFFRRSSRKD